MKPLLVDPVELEEIHLRVLGLVGPHVAFAVDVDPFDVVVVPVLAVDPVTGDLPVAEPLPLSLDVDVPPALVDVDPIVA